MRHGCSLLEIQIKRPINRPLLFFLPCVNPRTEIIVCRPPELEFQKARLSCRSMSSITTGHTYLFTRSFSTFVNTNICRRDLQAFASTSASRPLNADEARWHRGWERIERDARLGASGDGNGYNPVNFTILNLNL